MRFLKIAIFSVSILLFAVLFYAFRASRVNPYPDDRFDGPLPAYTEAVLPFSHQYNGDRFLPMMASAVIDVDADGIPELFIGGGENQADALFRFENGRFRDISGALGLTAKADATYGAQVVDVDNDGRTDLVVARDSGTYFYLNRGGKFELRKFDSFISARERVLSFGLADLNQDGKVDLYAAVYLARAEMKGQTIFNEEGYGGTSRLLLNIGNLEFQDITEAAGLLRTHNTFTGIFADVDGDFQQDLIVAQDTGHVMTWKNLGGLKFREMPNPMSLAFGYPMGIAAGDFDNDGEIDFYFSNVGTTVPDFLGRGDLRPGQPYRRSLLLMKNLGNFRFEDVSDVTRTANYEFSWGVLMRDLNLDGLQDILIAENYIDFPLHRLFKLPGRILLQTPAGKFASVEKRMAMENRAAEITPLVADFNRDGVPDIVRVNLGSKSRAFISTDNKDFRSIAVKLPDTVAVLGTKVILHFSSGRRITNFVIAGEGLGSDQSREILFGLFANDLAKSLEIILPSGQKKIFAVGAGQSRYTFSSSNLGL